jgi:small subunit ribosomal protein S3
MGRKINPIALRLGINKGWTSTWFANSKEEYAAKVGLDLKIKELLRTKLRPAGLDSMKLEWMSDRLEIDVFVARPGVAIGRGGTGIDDLQKEVKRIAKMEVILKIKEVKKPDISASVIARTIADGLERRQPPKLLMASAKEKAMLAGATGIKITVGGRINNAIQARTIKVAEGPVPLQTLKAEIDYAEEAAVTTDAGLFGVKVWVYVKDKEEDK